MELAASQTVDAEMKMEAKGIAQPKESCPERRICGNYYDYMRKLETVKNSCHLIKIIENYTLSSFKNVKKL